MEPKFIPADVESKLSQFWEDKQFFKASLDKTKKPFSIILPPPNANADLHLGHAMYVYEDIMIRYHKLMGDEVLWLPGADHAGFETQYVFEKQLQKQGKSRFDYDRETLFQMIWDFVMNNRSHMENQLKRLGFGLDWSKAKFTLDKDIVAIVYQTFRQLHDEGLIYRANRLVNYCVKDGTSFSDLEVVYQDRVDPLYYMKYGPFTLATTRPETKFGDTGVAVNPKDKRYKEYIGKEIEVEGLNGKFKVKVVGDDAVDPKFGTGVVKVTPAHDFTDFEIGTRHNLPLKQVIGFDGRLNDLTGPYKGLKIMAAREKIAQDLEEKGLMVKVDREYNHRVAVCYKCGTTIEPLPKEQWFVKVRPLADEAIKLIKTGEVTFFPARFKKRAIDWLTNFHDWNISRQIVWGIRIPAFKCEDCHEWMVTEGEKPSKCTKCSSTNLKQDDDTFDTWFSSGQWPFATLQTIGKDYFDHFYPTSVMETGYDILPWWVVRMIMLGYFKTKKVPFSTVFLHGMVRDKKGQKMSKSKGNVINPLEMADKYGADALRASLLFGTKEGNDLSLGEEKVVAMRNFSNKLWNIGRFIWLNSPQGKEASSLPPHESTERVDKTSVLKSLEKEFKDEQKKYDKCMKSYQFAKAFDLLYAFIWHRLADFYIEELKQELQNGNIKVLESLKAVYFAHLRMLHPYMPFVTEAVWKVFHGEDASILNTSSQ